MQNMLKRKMMRVLGIMVAVLIYAGEVWAIPIVGPKAMGMGGAFVAVADDTTAVYWNPAGLTKVKGMEIYPYIGGYAIDQISEKLIEIYDYTEDHKGDSDAPFYLIPKIEALQDKGVSGEIGGALFIGGTKVRQSIAVSAMGLLRFGGAIRTVDTEPAHLINFEENPTAVELSGESMNTYGVTYAKKIPGLSLTCGGTLKYADLSIYHTAPFILGTETSSEEGTAWGGEIITDEDIEKKSAFAVDIGFLTPLSKNCQIGLLGQNLLAAKPSFENGAEVTLFNPHVRAGVAFIPIKWVTLSMDLDLTKDKTVLGDSQQLSLGTELRSPGGFFALRGGILNDIGLDDTNPMFTAGFGVRIPVILAFDIAGGYDFEGEEFASSVALIIHF